MSRDTSSDQDVQYSLTAFIVGEAARKWAKANRVQRREIMLESLTDMVGKEGAEYVRTYIDVRETIWMSTTWSHGGPVPVAGPGTWQRLGDSLRGPFKNIHFVGIETAFMWKGYMEGAITSGDRGASEVVAALGVMGSTKL